MRRGGKGKIPGNDGFQTKRAPRFGGGASRTGLMGFQMVTVCRGVGKSK